MNGKRTSLEVIAPSVEEAIQNGLEELGLQREDVVIEILDEGTRGLFGLGSRHARIRLTIKEQDRPALSQPPGFQASATFEPGMKPGRNRGKIALPDDLEIPAEESVDEVLPPPETLMDDLTFQVVQETILDLLGLMNFEAKVKLRYGEPDEMRLRPPILVDIQGDDLSMLIGKRAETLNALQYIASLIVSKELGRYVTLIIDVEGYRERRHTQLRQLAKRMAEQAVKTGRRQILEPMPANERRIIHMELRNDPNVHTESVGEEPYRKVTIIPH